MKYFIAFVLMFSLTACGVATDTDADIELEKPMEDIQEGADVETEDTDTNLSDVESGIVDYQSCLAAYMDVEIIGQNETSVCTTTDGREFTLTIPGIWKNTDISAETQFDVCVMGGLPVDRTDSQNPVCFMPDGRILSGADSELMGN